MIKANEIRLNNLFLYNYKTDLISSVEWIQPNSVNIVFDRQPDLVNGVVCSPNDLIPIPLTEEWILKAGFHSHDYKKGYIGIDVHNENSMSTDFVLSYPGIMGEWQKFFAWEFNNYMFNKIEFVHQLQNFYFAMTGYELVFSLD